MKENKRILIIIPTYNEAKNIQNLLPLVLKQHNNIEILIVDDNSPDETASIVEKIIEQNPKVHIIKRQSKLGLGTAYVEGFRYALKNEYDYIIEMDADFSHNPKILPIFIEKIKEYDLVIGSRYIKGVNVVNWPLSRLLLSWFANLYTRIVTGMPVKDCTSGYKCFRKEVLQTINLNKIDSDGYGFQIEMHFKTWKSGFKIIEIPIIFTDRFHGESKMNSGIVKEAAWIVWKLRFLSLFGKLNK